MLDMKEAISEKNLEIENLKSRIQTLEQQKPSRATDDQISAASPPRGEVQGLQHPVDESDNQQGTEELLEQKQVAQVEAYMQQELIPQPGTSKKPDQQPSRATDHQRSAPSPPKKVKGVKHPVDKSKTTALDDQQGTEELLEQKQVAQVEAYKQQELIPQPGTSKKPDQQLSRATDHQSSAPSPPKEVKELKHPVDKSKTTALDDQQGTEELLEQEQVTQVEAYKQQEFIPQPGTSKQPDQQSPTSSCAEEVLLSVPEVQTSPQKTGATERQTQTERGGIRPTVQPGSATHKTTQPSPVSPRSARTTGTTARTLPPVGRGVGTKAQWSNTKLPQPVPSSKQQPSTSHGSLVIEPARPPQITTQKT